MMKTIVFLGLVGLIGAINLGAIAEGTGRSVYAAKEAECSEQANTKDFGIHRYQRHRFVVRCVAGLAH